MDGWVTSFKKITHFSLKNGRFSTDSLPEVVQMVSIMTFCQFVYPKIALVTLGKVISTKMSGQNSEIKENFPVTIFFVVDG